VGRVSLTVGLLLGLAVLARADDRTAEARRHFQAGTRLYSQGRFPEALTEFAAANRLKPDPVLLYDLGQTHRALGHPREALSYYRAYVEAAPYAVNHDEVVGKIKSVEDELRQRDREQAQVQSQLSAAQEKAAEAEAAQRTADELAARARDLLAEAEEAKSAALEAQSRAQKVLAQNRPTPIYKRWYLWTGIALVVAGGVTAAVVLTRPTAPSTSQGNFDF
jgi:tetratricopeptide (TPR) repeat protein